MAEITAGTLADSNRVRIEIARDVALHCPPQMGEEIALSGAVSRRVADKYADIELHLWVEKLPARVMRDTWVTALGGKQITHMTEQTDSGILWSVFHYHGVWVEAGWQTFTSMENLLGIILAAQVVDHERFCFAAMLEKAVVLREKGNLTHAKNLLQTYPAAVRTHIIQSAIENWQMPHAMQLRWTLLEREDHLPLLQCMIDDIYNGLRVLYALNGIWEPYRKWIKQNVMALPIRPERLDERINDIIGMPLFADNLVALFSLLIDILALVPPGAEVNEAMMVLRKFSVPH